MRKIGDCIFVVGALLALFTQTALAGDLNAQHKRELTVLGSRAMGLLVGVNDVKKILSGAEIEKLVAAGINLNGHLCARITDIRLLKISGGYEVTCIAYRGGSA